MTLDERIAEAELQHRAAIIALQHMAGSREPPYTTIRDEFLRDRIKAKSMLEALRELKESSEKPLVG